MLNLLVLLYSVDHELNIEKKKELNFLLGYLTNPYEYVYVKIFNIIFLPSDSMGTGLKIDLSKIVRNGQTQLCLKLALSKVKQKF